MDTATPLYIYLLDLVGTFVFALTGGFRAIKHECNILGILVLSTVVGVGGGMTRDMLLGITPPMALRNIDYLAVTITAGLCVFFYARRIALSWQWVMYFDAVGLAVFSAVGAEKAFNAGLGPVSIMCIAAVASAGGGVIRDVLTRELPCVFTGDLYATAACAGGGIFWLAMKLGLSDKIGFIVAFSSVITIRFIGMKWNIKLPRAKKLATSPSTLIRHYRGKE